MECNNRIMCQKSQNKFRAGLEHNGTEDGLDFKLGGDDVPIRILGLYFRVFHSVQVSARTDIAIL